MNADVLPRVLVTGAEGLVGTAVVTALVSHGHPVTTLSRPDAAAHDDVRVVRGDATDPDAVREAVDGCDAVVHLAAYPNPWDHPAAEVFGNNTLATFATLWTAAEAGVRRFAVAGSVNATGLLMHPRKPLPERLPIDERTPARIADPYSLSKRVDEETLRAVCERFDASGVIFRLPLVVPPDRAEGLRAWVAERVADGPAEGWGWIDSRDAAEAFRLAITVPVEGAHVVQLAALTTMHDEPTEELIVRHAPGVERAREFAGTDAAVDVRRARELLGFVPRFDRPGIVEEED
ncbi:NAD-dependent epimerase/dehydratase family protein [Microbacterium immunditiarum]|uniref:Nucleoside-diphosphate-sugar epimerase n=1 Tax=Microbacterium immunditiarum TaxID=337480 RepID=A0A7Y9GMF4_9MICO|nr:NAD(P)-dependent oxidoreductase [Microbacterium immunditiarum]NYE19016.1 nucleoside-diphosphate-sugar epimerase [Microbacterium immunditiarum]